MLPLNSHKKFPENFEQTNEVKTPKKLLFNVYTKFFGDNEKCTKIRTSQGLKWRLLQKTILN